MIQHFIAYKNNNIKRLNIKVIALFRLNLFIFLVGLKRDKNNYKMLFMSPV